jgi:CheY-like chemotaxis protein
MVLIADDDRLICESLADLFADCGHEVTIAHSGPEVLTMLRQRRPQLLLLDLSLPVLSGRDVAKRIVEDEDLSTIPFCVLSASLEQAPTGSVGVIRKPFDIDELMSIVKMYDRVAVEKCSFDQKPSTN